MCLFNILKILLLLFPVNNLLCLEIKHLYINSDKKDKTDNLCVKDDNLSNQIKCNNTLSNQLLSIISFKINYLYDKTSILYLGNKRWEITKDVNLIGMLSLNDINIKQLNKVNIGICGELEYKGLLSIFLLGKDKELKHIYVGASFNIMKQLDIVLSGNFEKNFVLYGDINILNLIRGELGVRKTNEEINLIARIAVIITKYIEIIIDINNIDIGIVIKNEENNKIGRVDELIRKVDVDKISETDTKITTKQQEEEIKTKSEEKIMTITDSLIDTNYNETEYTNTNEDSDGVLEINEADSNSESRDNETVITNTNEDSDGVLEINEADSNSESRGNETEITNTNEDSNGVLGNNEADSNSGSRNNVISNSKLLENGIRAKIFYGNGGDGGDGFISLEDKKNQINFKCKLSLVKNPNTFLFRYDNMFCSFTIYRQGEPYFNFVFINDKNKQEIKLFYENYYYFNTRFQVDVEEIEKLIKEEKIVVPSTTVNSGNESYLQQKLENCTTIRFDDGTEFSDIKFNEITMSLRQNIEKNFIIMKILSKKNKKFLLWCFDIVNDTYYLDGLTTNGLSIGFQRTDREMFWCKEIEFFQYTRLNLIPTWPPSFKQSRNNISTKNN